MKFNFEYIERTDCCINAIEIFKLDIFENLKRKNKNGIITFHSGTLRKNILDYFNFIENKDYIFAVEKSTANNKRGGGSKILNKYLLTPYAFKSIL